MVRDEAAKRNIPQYLKELRGITLTVEEIKGSEYRDVLVYNFFNPKLNNYWKVLKYLDLYPRRGNKKFHLEQIEVSEYDALIVELKMLYTLITRAKCTLVFCDEHIPEELIYIWKESELFDTL